MLADPVITMFDCVIKLAATPKKDTAPLILPARPPTLIFILRLLPSLCIPRQEMDVSDDHALSSQLLCPILQAPEAESVPSDRPCKVRLAAPVPAIFLVVRELIVPMLIVIDSDKEFTTWPEVTAWR
jgi:hypothetical protein